MVRSLHARFWATCTTRMPGLLRTDGPIGHHSHLHHVFSGKLAHWWGSWSPNGRRFATGSSDGTTRVWDATTGAELLTLSTPNKWSAQPEWSPNGELLAVAVSSLFGPTHSAIWRVWQSTDELVRYAYKCCVFRDLSYEERILYGL